MQDSVHGCCRCAAFRALCTNDWQIDTLQAAQTLLWTLLPHKKPCRMVWMDHRTLSLEFLCPVTASRADEMRTSVVKKHPIQLEGVG